MTRPEHHLPYVDAHAVVVPAPAEDVWAALRAYVDTSLAGGSRGPLGRVLGTSPAPGFAVEQSRPGERLALAGRHRFSRYALVFDLDPTAVGGTALRATTYAAFPGATGRVYRALVIGSRVHVVATRHMLHAIRRRTGGSGQPRPQAEPEV